MNTTTGTKIHNNGPDPHHQDPSYRNIGTFLALLLTAYLVPENLLFRSGFYACFLEPQYSATGNLERNVDNEIHRPSSGKKEVLVVGNSRMAEGFSAKLANEDKPHDDYWFVNLGVAATGYRVWYYMVRDVDPHRDRYAAITLTIDDYTDPDDYEDVADRASELPLLINRIRVMDILPYTLSFTTWTSRLQILRGLTMPGTIYQRDFQEFMEHPIRRLQRVREFRKPGSAEGYDREGMNTTLEGVQVDYSRETAVFPPGMPEGQQQELREFFFHRPEQKGRNRDFEVRWLGPLVDLYKGSRTKIIVFQAPRSPAPRPTPLAHLPETGVDVLRKRPWVTVIDGRVFEDLERPELFADRVHLNSRGRKQFSPRLAEVVKEALRRGL